MKSIVFAFIALTISNVIFAAEQIKDKAMSSKIEFPQGKFTPYFSSKDDPKKVKKVLMNMLKQIYNPSYPLLSFIASSTDRSELVVAGAITPKTRPNSDVDKQSAKVCRMVIKIPEGVIELDADCLAHNKVSLATNPIAEKLIDLYGNVGEKESCMLLRVVNNS